MTMKTLKTIMAVAVVLLITACGGKHFDMDSAKELCDKYEKEGFDNSDWNDFAKMYEVISNEYFNLMETSIDEAEEGSSLFEILREINKSGIMTLQGKANEIIEYNRNSMPENVLKRIEETNDKLEKRSEDLNAKIEQKFK